MHATVASVRRRWQLAADEMPAPHVPTGPPLPGTDVWVMGLYADAHGAVLLAGTRAAAPAPGAAATVIGEDVLAGLVRVLDGMRPAAPADPGALGLVDLLDVDPIVLGGPFFTDDVADFSLDEIGRAVNDSPPHGGCAGPRWSARCSAPRPPSSTPPSPPGCAVASAPEPVPAAGAGSRRLPSVAVKKSRSNPVGCLDAPSKLATHCPIGDAGPGVSSELHRTLLSTARICSTTTEAG
ncbi:hypothetical protein [Actinacidiphila alni]|uniref:hypothetical protein n=1 Tax=Actinacidiphila alni TaxID=380248 RepID=UPI001FED0B3E|nr:hypothetical protein [Actinacidiphila alni]